MKQFFITLSLMVFAAVCHAQQWNEAEYQQIEQAIRKPVFAQRDFLITKYGAKPSASAAQNQKAINRAIAECSKRGGGRVVIPAGVWLTGAVRLQSKVNLYLSEGATLKFAFEPKLYPLVKTSWEGLGCWNYSPCIYAYQCRDVAVTGKGTVDGNGSKQTWWQWHGRVENGFVKGVTKEAQSLGSRDELLRMAEDDVPIDERRFGPGKGLRPQLVNFNECDGVLVEGVTLINSPFWVTHPLLSRNITVDGVKVWNEGPNGDGCDPEACEYVLIQNCTFHTGDDCIAIKSGRNNDGRLWNRPSKNIIIRRCVMEDGHGGVVIGSEISGGCQNVYAEDCEMDSPELERVLRIKTNNCRGGLIENVNMRRITVGQCKESVLRINLDYEPKEQCYRGFEPTVRRVYMENVTCKKSKYGVYVTGLNNIENVYDVTVRNCSFEGVTSDPVKITGKTRNIIFDNLTVNGQLVLADSANIYRNMALWMALSEMKRTPQPWLLDFSTKPKWSYVMGIELEGLLDAYLENGKSNNALLQYLKAYPEKMVDAKGNITGYNLKDYNLDNVRTAKFLSRIGRLTNHSGLDKATATCFKQLLKQPRTKEGVWWHKAVYANQVWLDGIFMGLPFYTHYVRTYNGYDTAVVTSAKREKEIKRVFDDAVDQIIKTGQRTYDAKTRLWKHAWDETHTAFWADKQTGLSQHTWARALGWYAMAMIEVLDELPQNHARRQEVVDMFQKVMQSVVHYQDKKSGVWYDVMDVKDARNYLEATASSMFAYCLLKGARLGYLDERYQAAGVKAYNGILREFVRIDKDTTVTLTRCCAVSGLGPAPGPYVTTPNFKRDGSFDYYMSEPIRNNDPKGVGPFIWASLEMKKYYRL